MDSYWLQFSGRGFLSNSCLLATGSRLCRVAIASMMALFAGQFINDYVLAKMKILTKGRYLWSRTIGSTIAGQAADSTLFYLIALYAVIPNGLLLKSILSAWFAKVAIEALITPMTYLVVKKLKQAEKIDYFDKNTNFSPFVLR
jgi:uncharacterized integral membrane protein (TIGR00697 family)